MPITQCDSLISAGIAAYKDSRHANSLELLTRARTIAKQNKWHEQEFMALNNIGANYHKLLEYGEAVNYYLDAYAVAIKELAPKNEMTVLNNIAVLYSEEKKYDQASDYFNRAYTVAKQNSDLVKTGIYAINLGNIALDTDQPRQARAYFSEAERLLVNNPEFLVIAKLGIANCFLLEGNPDIARNISQELLENSTELEFGRIDIKLLMLVANCYLKENKPNQALTTVDTALQKNPPLESKIELFRLKTDIYVSTKAFDKALQFKDSIFDASEKFNSIKNGKLFENSQIKFELMDYKNKATQNAAKLSGERKLFYTLLFVILVTVLFVVWMLHARSQKLNQKKLIAERNQKILVLELEKEKDSLLILEKQLNEDKAVALLEQQKLKNEVELKNRKLTAKALYLSGRNQMIDDILQQLSSMDQVSKNNQVVAHIQSLQAQLKKDGEWDSFITHFEEINQGFLQALRSKHQELTVNEIRYISYIYMNLSTKEIASMLNISPDSCRKRKERILTKLGLSKNDNLNDYLASL